MIARLFCVLLAGFGFLAGLLFALRMVPEPGDPRAVAPGRPPRQARTRPSRSLPGQTSDRPAAGGRSGTSRKRTPGQPKPRRKRKNP